MSGLAFYTSDELIDELMRRKTFYGVVVRAADDHKQDVWPEVREFKVHYNENLEQTHASNLLETVAQSLNFGPG